MVRRITASYTNYLEYVVPKNLPLLSVDENEAVTEENVPFSWWVKWSTFYYYDKNGKMQELPLDSESTGAKRPSDFEDEDDGEEYEEDVTQHECSGCSELKSCGNFDEDKKFTCEDCNWCDDHICLALNWNQCLMKGRHPKTSDEHWNAFIEDEPYSEERYNKLLALLSPEQLKIKNALDNDE